MPVVRGCDTRSIDELRADVDELAEKAREGTLAPEELRGSTFTVTSAGKLAGLFVTPLVNHPEVGDPRRAPHRRRAPSSATARSSCGRWATQRHVRPSRRRRRARARSRDRAASPLWIASIFGALAGASRIARARPRSTPVASVLVDVDLTAQTSLLARVRDEALHPPRRPERAARRLRVARGGGTRRDWYTSGSSSASGCWPRRARSAVRRRVAGCGAIGRFGQWDERSRARSTRRARGAAARAAATADAARARASLVGRRARVRARPRVPRGARGAGARRSPAPPRAGAPRRAPLACQGLSCERAEAGRPRRRSTG